MNGCLSAFVQWQLGLAQVDAIEAIKRRYRRQHSYEYAKTLFSRSR